MTTNTTDTKRRAATAGVGRLVRRLERERRSWTRRPDRGDGPVVATEVAWRAGGGEGVRVGAAAHRPAREGGPPGWPPQTHPPPPASGTGAGRIGRPWPGSPSSGRPCK